MELLLSSDAWPGAPVAALREAARRRALAGLELRVGEGSPPADAGVRWLLPPEDPAVAPAAWAREARRLGAGVLLRPPAADPPVDVPAALLHGSDPGEAERAARWAEAHDARTAWAVRPADFDAGRWAAVLDATGPRLAHVRLLGAGPEAEAGAGADGTGWLLGRLALRGYGGTLALAPSSPEALGAWARWLRRGRGWGCGTAAEKRAAADARRAAARTETQPAQTPP